MATASWPLPSPGVRCAGGRVVASCASPARSCGRGLGALWSSPAWASWTCMSLAGPAGGGHAASPSQSVRRCGLVCGWVWVVGRWRSVARYSARSPGASWASVYPPLGADGDGRRASGGAGGLVPAGRGLRSLWKRPPPKGGCFRSRALPATGSGKRLTTRPEKARQGMAFCALHHSCQATGCQRLLPALPKGSNTNRT